LFELVHFVVAQRPGSPLDHALRPELATALDGRWCATPEALREAPSGRVLQLRQPLHDESATSIRARIAAGEPWRDQVPAAVAAYIQRYRLYLNGDEGRGPAAPPRL